MFSLHFATIKGYKGFSGIAAGSIYTALGGGSPWIHRLKIM